MNSPCLQKIVFDYILVVIIFTSDTFTSTKNILNGHIDETTLIFFRWKITQNEKKHIFVSYNVINRKKRIRSWNQAIFIVAIFTMSIFCYSSKR